MSVLTAALLAGMMGITAPTDNVSTELDGSTEARMQGDWKLYKVASEGDNPDVPQSMTLCVIGKKATWKVSDQHNCEIRFEFQGELSRATVVESGDGIRHKIQWQLDEKSVFKLYLTRAEIKGLTNPSSQILYFKRER
jgi:hypothetical protein